MYGDGKWFDCGHTIQYTDHVSQKCPLETYMILWTNVTPINLILKRSWKKERKVINSPTPISQDSAGVQIEKGSRAPYSSLYNSIAPGRTLMQRMLRYSFNWIVWWHIPCFKTVKRLFDIFSLVKNIVFKRHKLGKVVGRKPDWLTDSLSDWQLC